MDDVLCGVQAHKCPKGGLEPLSAESPILGMRPANHYTMPAFENFTERKETASCFLCPCCCCQVWARVRVWKGVDDVLCSVQAHKCPKGGLEPLSVESPILGMRPGNHYTMPAFGNFTEGKETASCFSCPCCCCQVWARACVCGKVWMMFCAGFKRTNVQRQVPGPHGKKKSRGKNYLASANILNSFTAFT